MKIIFTTKKEVADYIVGFYQSDIASRIMLMDEYHDECDSAVNREHYLREAEGDENLMNEMREEQEIKVGRCCHICSILPTMELNGKDITSELWHIILDAPLAYVCYGGVVRHLPSYKDIVGNGMFLGDFVEQDLNLAGKFRVYLEEKLNSLVG